MSFRLLLFCCFWGITQTFAQSNTAVVAQDSVAIFQKGADNKTIEQYKALWQNPVHTAFWEAFQQKFADDFDSKNKQNYCLHST
ncbi:MAG: hypothetical protein R2822_07295 [Spirosomataceae bacterium]